MVSDPNYVRFLLLHSQLCAAAARRDGAEVVRIADGHIKSGGSDLRNCYAAKGVAA